MVEVCNEKMACVVSRLERAPGKGHQMVEDLWSSYQIMRHLARVKSKVVRMSDDPMRKITKNKEEVNRCCRCGCIDNQSPHALNAGVQDM